MKRGFDVIVASLLLLMLSPVFCIVSIIVKCGSEGPIFYRQIRVGRNGIHFNIFKFRTMYENVPDGISLTMGDGDTRLTHAGRWMKKLKLDELPQLFNVLKGDMSLVGPRPEVPRYVRLYTESQLDVLSVRPGLTDRASIKYRHESLLLAEAEDPEDLYINNIMPDKLAINLDYVRTHSLIGDLRILAATVVAVLRVHLP